MKPTNRQTAVATTLRKPGRVAFRGTFNTRMAMEAVQAIRDNRKVAITQFHTYVQRVR